MSFNECLYSLSTEKDTAEDVIADLQGRKDPDSVRPRSQGMGHYIDFFNLHFLVAIGHFQQDFMGKMTARTEGGTIEGNFHNYLVKRLGSI